MSQLSLILRGLRFHWRSHASVFAGVTLATAILAGALIMGDSVDYSLRRIALARLGQVHYALHLPNRFVKRDLPEFLAQKIDARTAALLHIRGMAICQNAGTGESRQINQVQVLGVDERFWPLLSAPDPDLGENDVAVNEKLAVSLGISAGDSLALRIEPPSLMALDAPLSPRDEERSSRTLFTVKAVIPDMGAGRFSLNANQAAPYNAFVRIDRLERILDLEGRINTLLVGDGATGVNLRDAVRSVWALEDVGLRFRACSNGTAQLESDRIFLEAPVVEAALAMPGATGTLAYLVNSIAHGEASTPYSFAVAGPVPGTLKDDEAVINQWLADQLSVREGERISVAYYEVTASNAFIERTREFTVREIRSMKDLAIERELMPEFPGLSDVESCRDWNIGMPMDNAALRDTANEAYWKAYRQTPKLLVTLRAGQDMWANRFGAYTAVRFVGGAERSDVLRATVKDKVDPATLGLTFAPVREQALQAVEHALDFGGLFLGMSFFLIAAALLLTGLLFVFSVQQRSEERGALLVMGFRTSQVRRLILAETGLVALAASTAGTYAGTIYARLLILGLSRFWESAVAGTSIYYHAQSGTLLFGGLAGFFCATGTIALTAWRQMRRPPGMLLTADFSLEGTRIRPGRFQYVASILSPICGLGLGIAWAAYVLYTEPANMALPFFGIGSLMLISGIILWRSALIILGTKQPSKHPTLFKLAVQHVARRSGRSMSATGLLACGVFLVLSVASMREDLSAHAGERWSGTGGFELYAQTTTPMQEFSRKPLDDAEVLVIAMRVRDGDDASCLNLNRTSSPRLLGVNPGEMADLGAFDRTKGSQSVWRQLEKPLPSGAIPALAGDTDTAMWGLQAKTGPIKGEELLYRDELGNDVRVQLVGSLPMRLSVFQGSVLISQADFTRLYPSESGFRVFLIDAPEQQQDHIAALLRKKFDRSGMDVVPSVQRLKEFYTVESTYLAMFLVLGGMGVTLGGVGMGMVMLRNVLERRGELAMLGVLGYRREIILKILFVEHTALLAAGTCIGAAAAAVSMIPGVIASETRTPLALQMVVLLLIVLSGAVSMSVALLLGRPGDDLAALRNE